MFPRGVLILLCLGVYLANAKSVRNVNPEVSVTSNVADRIAGGHTAQRNQFPYQAALRYQSDLSHFCGAVIIGVSWVVTVQHCVVYHSPESFEVGVGAHALRFDAILYEVSRLVMHPNYDHQILTNDIALVQTTIPITMLSGRVAPIAFSAQYIGAYVPVRSSSWGYTSVSILLQSYYIIVTLLIFILFCMLSVEWHETRVFAILGSDYSNQYRL